MALSAVLARVGVTGAAFVGPLGTTSPTGLVVPVAPFEELGYISEDGLTRTFGEDRTDFTPWQSTSPIRSVTTSSTKTFTVTAWESNALVNSLYYQVPLEDMTETDGVVSFDEPDRPAQDVRFWVFDVFDGDYQHRFLCPRAEVTARGDIQYASGSIVGFPLTITAYPGDDGISIRHLVSEGWSLPAEV